MPSAAKGTEACRNVTFVTQVAVAAGGFGGRLVPGTVSLRRPRRQILQYRVRRRTRIRYTTRVVFLPPEGIPSDISDDDDGDDDDDTSDENESGKRANKRRGFQKNARHLSSNFGSDISDVTDETDSLDSDRDDTGSDDTDVTTEIEAEVDADADADAELARLRRAFAETVGRDGDDGQSQGRPGRRKGRGDIFGSRNAIDILLEDTNPDYETWQDRNSNRSLLTYRIGGGASMLDADELNDSFRADHLQRHRHVLAPDEKFGALFMWDVVVANARQLEVEAWKQVAQENDLIPPDLEDIVRAEQMPAESAITRVFYWSADWGLIKRAVHRKQEVLKQLEESFAWKTASGLQNFVNSLIQYGVKCVLCASRPREVVEQTVKTLGLSQIFTKNEIVSMDDEVESIEQMLLTAALKCERPPDKCVVFTDNPKGITAGHEISSKVVALIGAHPAYEMKTADHVISDFDDLVVYNVRRLFSEQGAEFMDPQTEFHMERT